MSQIRSQIWGKVYDYLNFSTDKFLYLSAFMTYKHYPQQIICIVNKLLKNNSMKTMKYKSTKTIAKEVVKCLKKGNTVLFEVCKVKTVNGEMEICKRLPVTESEEFFKKLKRENEKPIKDLDIYNELGIWIIAFLSDILGKEVLSVDILAMLCDHALTKEELKQIDSMFTETDRTLIVWNSWLALKKGQKFYALFK